MNLVISLPAKGICLTHEPITYPSEIGNTWVTPSPESITVPVKSEALMAELSFPGPHI